MNLLKYALFYPEKTKDNVMPNVCDEHNYMAGELLFEDTNGIDRHMDYWYLR